MACAAAAAGRTQCTRTFGSPVPIPLDAEAFVREPQLMLPPGTWHAYVVAEFALGDCGSSTINMRTELPIEVLDGPPWSEDAPATPRPSPTPVPDNVAIHIVNLDPSPIEIVFRNKVVASLGCGESTVISGWELESAPLWHFIVRTEGGAIVGATELDGRLPAGIVVRDGAVLSGPWPMSYGPAGALCGTESLPSPSPSPPSPESSDQPVSAIVDDEFGRAALQLTAGHAVYTEGTPIDLEVTYRFASGEELVASYYETELYLMLTQLDATNPTSRGTSYDNVCTDLGRVDGTERRVVLTGHNVARITADSVPKRLDDLFVDGKLQLPVGRWEIGVDLEGAFAKCDRGGASFESYALATSIVIEVVPG